MIEKDNLADDRKQHLWSDEDDLFGVVPIDLNEDGITDYLVYPAPCLASMRGAHSIALWLFKGKKDGSQDAILTGWRVDEVEVAPSKTNGFRDIHLIYHAACTEFYTFRFDGHEYKLTESRYINQQP